MRETINLQVVKNNFKYTGIGMVHFKKFTFSGFGSTADILVLYFVTINFFTIR